MWLCHDLYYIWVIFRETNRQSKKRCIVRLTKNFSHDTILSLCSLLTFYWHNLLPSSPLKTETNTNPDPTLWSPCRKPASRFACLIRRLRLFCIINMKPSAGRIISCCMWAGSWITPLLQAVMCAWAQHVCVCTHIIQPTSWITSKSVGGFIFCDFQVLASDEESLSSCSGWEKFLLLMKRSLFQIIR